MSKIILVSFADRRYRNALKRLKEYTEPFPFTERYFLTQDNSLTKEYWRSLKPWLYRRGYGYWEWKGKLVKQYFYSLNYGDILIWSDAGVYWNSTPKALERFDEYIKMLDNKTSILAFQEPYIEEQWTKGDLLKALDVYDNENICKSLQLWSGVFVIMKNAYTVQLIDDWSSINEIHKEFETDKRSSVPNKEGFVEHRHDQSSFSLLVKKVPHIEISYKETQIANKQWKLLHDYPVQARRHKEEKRPLSVILYNKILRPWRMLLNIYFRQIRNYDFAGESYPW